VAGQLRRRGRRGRGVLRARRREDGELAPDLEAVIVEAPGELQERLEVQP